MSSLDIDPTDVLSDADLILAVREGDVSAADEIYRRHHRAALAFAEALAGRTLAPDLVADAFVRILDLLRRGGGPTVAFRSYLYTTVRNIYVDHVRHHARQVSLPDFTSLDAELAFGDGTDDRADRSMVQRAFESLPARWQAALWYTTVEGESLEAAGEFLGLAPNAVAALTFRAREGLRQAYLAEHLNLSVDEACAAVWVALPKYVRGGIAAKTREHVEEHLDICLRCTAAASELGAVNAGLRGLLLPALLGPLGGAALHDALVGVEAGETLAPGEPEPVPATASAAAWGAKLAGVLAAAAAFGGLVLAWPQDRPASTESGRPVAQPPVPEQRTPHRPPHPGPPTARIAPIDVTGGPEHVGAPTATRLAGTGGSWHHVHIPVSPSSDRLRLTVELPASEAVHVHREPGYGAWRCGKPTPVSDAVVRRECMLAAGSTAADFGIDVLSGGPVAVSATLRGPDRVDDVPVGG